MEVNLLNVHTIWRVIVKLDYDTNNLVFRYGVKYDTDAILIHNDCIGFKISRHS